jgi:hypothetical protein
VHGYLVIAFSEIHLAENGAAGHPCGQIHHVGQGVCIMDGDEVQPALIATGPPAAVCLLDHVERGGPGAV